jgi:hypothetical protein
MKRIGILLLCALVMGVTTAGAQPAPTKFAQPPNMNNGFDTQSWKFNRPNPLVADDWLCVAPEPVTHLTWWGSYIGWMEDTNQQVPPPYRPIAFRISFHKYLAAQPGGPQYSTPGDLIQEEWCSVFTEEWYGAVPRWDQQAGLVYEHEYKYDQDLLTPFSQDTGTTYFLNIQAVLEQPAPYPWGWKNSPMHWNDDAVISYDRGESWMELRWPAGHPMEGTSMDMAFQISAGMPPMPKWMQEPNMTNGFDLHSWDLVTTGVVVADDWECTTGLPITHVRWWGSYEHWMETTGQQVDPPQIRPIGFKLSWHEYNAGPPSQPGPLIAEVLCTNFTEQWYGAVPVWHEPSLFEHEYVYDQDLTDLWPQEVGQKYFLDIQAVYDTAPLYKWGWKNSEVQRYDDAVISYDHGEHWSELFWPSGHPLQGQSMDMAFELWSTAQPTPTPTPTPTATPADKWVQPPNMIDGFNVHSWESDYPTPIVADDWLCTSTLPVTRITWWGSYIGWMEDTNQPVPPPPDHPIFRIERYQYKPGPPYSMPGTLIDQEFCDLFSEEWYGAVPRWDAGQAAPKYEHEFIYHQILPAPMLQDQGTTYFLSISAIFEQAPPYPWGWKNSANHWNDDAVISYDDGNSWEELLWPEGHPLYPSSMDMAFLLWVGAPQMPDLKWQQYPNMQTGFDVESWDQQKDSGWVADDWECLTGLPINHIRWWGSYEGWMEYEDAPVPPPQDRPTYFRLAWREYIPGPPYSHAGTVLTEAIVANHPDILTEKWYGVVPQWDNPQLMEHEYVYDVTLWVPWAQDLGTTYFLNIQAIYEQRPIHKWGWKNSEQHWNDDAVVSYDHGVTWDELTWPSGHRLYPNSMDMAFELSFVQTPTPTPTSTPTPTPTPSPTPGGPTPTPTPSPTPGGPTPTPTPSPTPGGPTPTPSPTPSGPTPTPTPSPTETPTTTTLVKQYTFDSSTEGWSFLAPSDPRFSGATSGWSGGRLSITSPNDSTSRVGLFTGPLEIPYVAGNVYRGVVTVSSSQATASANPQLRLRWVQDQSLESASLVLNASGSFSNSLSTDPTTSTFSIYFAPIVSGSLGVAFDMLDFSATQYGTFYVDEIAIERFASPGAGTAVKTYTSSADFSNWSFVTNISPYGAVTSGVGTGTLSIASSLSAASNFGWWQSSGTANELTYVADKLYRVTYTLRSASSAERNTLPQIRLRCQNEDGQMTQTMELNSQGTGPGAMPDTSGTNYDVYWETPALPGSPTALEDGFITVLDVLDFDSSKGGTIYMDSVAIDYVLIPE